MKTKSKTTFKPYDLATIATPNSKRRRTVEVISHPFSSDAGLGGIAEAMGGVSFIGTKKADRIKIRWVPGDPTTIGGVAVADLEPSRHGKRVYLQVAEVRAMCADLQPLPASYLPEDMLWYDNCALYEHELHEEGEFINPPDADWNERRGLRISTETDTDLSSPGFPCERQPRVLVYRVTDRKDPQWTTARWASFGVTIKNLHTRKLGGVS